MFFTVEKIEKQLDELRLAIRREIHPIPRWKFSERNCDGAQHPDFDDCDWADFTIGDAWGGYDVLTWFRARVPIPAHLRDKKLALRFLVGPKDGGNSTAEALLHVNGRPLQAIDVWHLEAWLPPELLRDEHIHVAIKAWSGVLEVPPHRHFKLAQLIWIDEPTERFYYLVKTTLGAVRQLAGDDLRRNKLLRIVDDAVRQVHFVTHRPEQFYTYDARGTAGGSTPVKFVEDRAGLFYSSIEQAAAWLEDHLRSFRNTDDTVPTVVGVGHAHIDLAWLWRLSHAREKAARTFTTVLHLMRQYSDYCFLQSSPQLYKFVQEDYPELFARIKEMVLAGRWEATGGMWVEADTNIPGGESLVRQILFGKRYFRDEFGVDNRVLWMPDVFGYSWALPQLMRRSGLNYFMTTKISWNQYNRFPYDTFTWRGIDGSEVLAHFVTTPEEGARHLTYNGRLTPFEVKGIWDRYQQKEINDELMLIYGWGDGGGGPTQEMLESANGLRNLSGMPRVELGKAEPYFERLAERLDGSAVPLWDGELYLEFHRGTYTSQAFSKRANRKAEVLYHDAEWLSALADLLLQQRQYPAQALHEGWELLLLNQFHDILPGSSIREVYEDSREHYARIDTIGQSAAEAAQEALLASIAVEQESLVVFNSLGWDRDDLVEYPYDAALAGKTIRNPSGDASPVQVVEREDGRRLLLRAEAVPALGYRVYPLVDQGASTAGMPDVSAQTDQLQNRFYHIRLNEKGQITAIYDKLNRREVLARNGVGNVLQAFQDKPMAFDAWDIDIFYREKMQVVEDLVEADVEEAGPLRGVLRLRWRFNDSTITQRLTLYADSPRIDFHTEVDWHEQQVLLKVAFPVAVRSTKATYDIQWGNIERPTHWNTSWDWARFETVGHKWVDLSEGNYGVSLLNDCKYGHDVKDNVLRLSLIKSPVRPDPTADQGSHVFSYSLLPHAGGWREGQVTRDAYALNYPLRSKRFSAQPGGHLPAQFAFARPDSEHVIIETIKKAEDDEAWIVRVYEYQQYRSNEVALEFGRPVARAVECNLLEEEERDIQSQGHRLVFGIAPYEIKTFKVWLEV
ncbi:MAG TPA: alpha-mannosidase [Herpetosiphonaceae bacterium]|nr:alpha-mannosidase [Herpetosiphonaceae bacterium]